MKTCVCLLIFSLAIPAYSAPKTAPQAQVKSSIVSEKTKAPTRVAPNGKARIRILAQGQNSFIGELWLAPNAQVPLHRDPTEEYLHIISGQGHITIDGKTTAVSAGSTVFMKANAEVQFKNGPNPLVCIQVFSGPQSANKYMKWPLAQP